MNEYRAIFGIDTLIRVSINAESPEEAMREAKRLLESGEVYDCFAIKNLSLYVEDIEEV